MLKSASPLPSSPMPVPERLHTTRGFVFDMDGTLVLGDKNNHGFNPLPGALELTQWLTAQNKPFLVFTNGTARPPEQYAGLLREAGFAISDQQFMTPASSAVDLFSKKGYRRVMVLGGAGLSRPLEEAGIEAVAPRGKQRVDAVLAGWYREFTMDCLDAAYYAVSEGASYYSASEASFFATANGRALGTSRVISAMIKDATGCRINVVGKPALDALRSAARRLSVKLKDLAVVGDDPVLEVPMAHRGRAMAIAVNTGLGDSNAYAHLPESRQPHLTLPGVKELLHLLRG